MGGGGAPGSAQAGLPFGGIPHELQDGVDLLLAEEPDRGESDVVFTQLPTEHESKKLTLTSLLMEYPGMCALAAAAGRAHRLFTQLGPSLVSYAINHGLTPPALRLRRRRGHGGAVPGLHRASRRAPSGARPG